MIFGYLTFLLIIFIPILKITRTKNNNPKYRFFILVSKYLKQKSRNGQQKSYIPKFQDMYYTKMVSLETTQSLSFRAFCPTLSQMIKLNFEFGQKTLPNCTICLRCITLLFVQYFVVKHSKKIETQITRSRN